jgi:dihydroxyacid dehydratase/phosphogluconate dehydratase
MYYFTYSVVPEAQVGGPIALVEDGDETLEAESEFRVSNCMGTVGR